MTTTILRRKTQWLPVRLTKDELEIIGKEQAAKTLEADRLDEKKKAIAAELAGQVKALESRVRDCARMVDTGIEHRDVMCREELNERTLTVRCIREDTEEVVSERTMTIAERQTSFPLEPALDA